MVTGISISISVSNDLAIPESPARRCRGLCLCRHQMLTHSCIDPQCKGRHVLGPDASIWFAMEPKPLTECISELWTVLITSKHSDSSQCMYCITSIKVLPFSLQIKQAVLTVCKCLHISKPSNRRRVIIISTNLSRVLCFFCLPLAGLFSFGRLSVCCLLSFLKFLCSLHMSGGWVGSGFPRTARGFAWLCDRLQLKLVSSHIVLTGRLSSRSRQYCARIRANGGSGDSVAHGHRQSGVHRIHQGTLLLM